MDPPFSTTRPNVPPPPPPVAGHLDMSSGLLSDETGDDLLTQSIIMSDSMTESMMYGGASANESNRSLLDSSPFKQPGSDNNRSISPGNMTGMSSFQMSHSLLEDSLLTSTQPVNLDTTIMDQSVMDLPTSGPTSTKMAADSPIYAPDSSDSDSASPEDPKKFATTPDSPVDPTKSFASLPSTKQKVPYGGKYDEEDDQMDTFYVEESSEGVLEEVSPVKDVQEVKGFTDFGHGALHSKGAPIVEDGYEVVPDLAAKAKEAEAKSLQLEQDRKRLKEEEDRLEAERLRREEEEKKRREEQEKLRRQEEERVRREQENQERLRREEEERVKREKEAQELRKKKEEEERARLAREAEESRKRQEEAERARQLKEQARINKLREEEETERRLQLEDKMRWEREEAKRIAAEQEEERLRLEEERVARLQLGQDFRKETVKKEEGAGSFSTVGAAAVSVGVGKGANQSSSDQASSSSTSSSTKAMASSKKGSSANKDQGDTGATTQGSCPFSAGNWLTREGLHPIVSDLVFWKDPKKSGIVFGLGLFILFSLACCSVISVVAYTGLLALMGTLSFRVYKNILQAVQKTNEGHPFKEYLEVELTPEAERVHKMVDVFLGHTTCVVKKLRSVFLVEDIIDSIKFLVLFWLLTYIGSWFNGLTLIILGYITAFSAPKVYEMHKEQIDQALGIACTNINGIMEQVKSKIPYPSKDKKQ